MTAPLRHREMEAEARKPAGLAEYEARCAIRELIETYGVGGASELVAMYLQDEAQRTRQ